MFDWEKYWDFGDFYGLCSMNLTTCSIGFMGVLPAELEEAFNIVFSFFD